MLRSRLVNRMPTEKPKTEGRARWIWVGLALLALTLRVVHVFSMRASPLFEQPIMDARFHVEWARAMASGESFLPGPFFRAPLYIMFLAAMRTLAGEGLLLPRLIQAGFGALTTVLTYRIGRRAFDQRVGILAGLAAATYWVLIYFDGELLIPTLIVPLDLAAILLALRLREERCLRTSLATGLLWGLSAIARPNVLLFMPFLALWLLFAKRLRCALALAVGVLLPILPVTTYNLVVGGEFVLISSQAGVNFWIGNNPQSDGSTAIVPGTRGGWWEGYYDSIALAEREQGRELKAAEVSRHYSSKAWSFLLSEPQRSIPLLWKKFSLFWKDWELGNNQEVRFFCRRFSPVARYSPLGFGLLASLGLLGFVLAARRWRKLFPLWAFLPVYTASVVAFFINSRFRVPLLPVLMIFGAHACVWILERARDKDWRRLLPAAAIALIVGVWSQRMPEGLRTDDSNGWMQLGAAHFEQGRAQEAESALREALAANPNNAVAGLVLARVLDSQERTLEAIPVLEQAWARDPRLVDSFKLLLGLHARTQRYEDLRNLAGSVRGRGGVVESMAQYGLGLAALQERDADGALRCFEQARRLDPQSFDAAFMVGFVHESERRPGPALEAYSAALERRRTGEAQFVEQAYAKTIEILIQRGSRSEAWHRAQEWSQWAPESASARAAVEQLGP